MIQRLEIIGADDWSSDWREEVGVRTSSLNGLSIEAVGDGHTSVHKDSVDGLLEIAATLITSQSSGLGGRGSNVERFRCIIAELSIRLSPEDSQDEVDSCVNSDDGSLLIELLLAPPLIRPVLSFWSTNCMIFNLSSPEWQRPLSKCFNRVDGRLKRLVHSELARHGKSLRGCWCLRDFKWSPRPLQVGNIFGTCNTQEHPKRWSICPAIWRHVCSLCGRLLLSHFSTPAHRAGIRKIGSGF